MYLFFRAVAIGFTRVQSKDGGKEIIAELDTARVNDFETSTDRNLV
jgi:hypothetical protein